MYFSILFVIFCVTLPNTHRTTAYEFLEFVSNANDIYHVTTHNASGDIYIGAHNSLYRISENFTIIANITTCQTNDCDNINKVLAIDYDHDKLITCGGGNNGRCEARSLVDLSLNGNDFEEEIVSGLSAVGIIAPGLDDNAKRTNVLYISSGHTSLDPLAPYYTYPYINSRRSLQTASIFQIIQAVDNDFISPSSTYVNRHLQYKSAFVHGNYIYFVAFRQKDASPDKDEHFYSRLSRVCQDNSFHTLSDINIRCVVNNVDYNLIQAMSVGSAGPDLAASLGLQAGQDVLYGVFAKGDGSGHLTGQSALCVYKWENIEDAFVKALNGCLTDDSDQIKYRLTYADRAECENRINFTTTEVLSLMCPPADITNVHRVYSQGIYSKAAVSKSMLNINGTTMKSITVAVEENHTIAFIGTDDGTLMKIKIMNQTSATVYETTTIDAGQEVRADTYLDESSNHVIVLTSKKLVKLPVANCSQFTTCDDCIRPIGQDADPYCGWCTLQKICTRNKECKHSSWLPSNSAQCIKISNVEPPFIPYTDENIKVRLTVQQLPPLNINQSYNCKFGDVVSPAMKQRETLTCTSPLAAQVPQIPPANAFVDVPLSVHSSETNVGFVTSQFTFFDCNAITSCSECVTSFACDWCLYINICTHNASLFCTADLIIQNGNATADGVKGQGSCPQIHQVNEELIHVNVEKEVRIPVSNLPNTANVTGYECVLTIEGKKSTIAATVNDSTSTIICSQYLFDYVVDEQEVSAGIQVIWNNNNLLDNTYQVTLYKCDVNRPDCSRCLSSNTTRPALDCVWCGDQCSYDPFCSSKVNDCPGPVITQIFPESVATVTNQAEPNFVEVIELSGTDFGQMMSDIDNIIINNKECEIIEDGFNIDLQSVKCRAPVFNTASQQNVIISVKGKTSPPVSIIFQNPKITDISPKFGILAGGTNLNIIGLYLDTGNDLEVSIGGSQCYITNLSETQIMCITSIYTSEAKLQVTVKFGEAIRGGVNFTYTPNPTVSDVQPRSSIQAGGRTINVSGMDFKHVQEAKILVNGIANNKSCDIVSNVLILCESPPADLLTSDHRRSRRQADDASLPLMFSFDGFIPGLGDQFHLAFYPDPIYFLFSNETIYEDLVKNGIYQISTEETNILQLMGFNINLASDVNDVEVFIGSVKCKVKSLSETLVIAEVPDKQPEPVDGQNYPLVMILHGNLEVTFGPIQYEVEGLSLAIEIIIIITSTCAVIITFAIVIWFYRSRSHARKLDEATVKFFAQSSNADQVLTEEEENTVCDHDAYTDMVNTDKVDTGSNRRAHYLHCLLFSGCKMIPEEVEGGYTALLKNDPDGLLALDLLLDKTLLLKLVEILDEDPSVTKEDRQNFSALFLLAMINENKTEYLLQVLEMLLCKHIEKQVKLKKRKQVLNLRTGMVIEQLVSHWMVLCMYKYVVDNVSVPLSSLIEAIRLRVESGAVDAIYHHCQYSINENKLLPSDVTSEDIHLMLVIDDETVKQKLVKVKSCDTLLQVKNKLINVMFNDQHCARRPKATQVKLEWRISSEQCVILKDEYHDNQENLTKRKLKTIKEFGIQDNSMVVIVNESDSEVNASDGYERIKQPNYYDTHVYESVQSGDDVYHILEKKPEDTDVYDKIADKVDVDDFARMSETKKLYQQCINELFEVMFSSPAKPLPLCVKYLFDILDNLASKHDITINDLNLWKNNSLGEMVWLQIITNPAVICDVQQTPTIDATLGVIKKVFQDSWSSELFSFNENSPSHRRLFVTEIPRYRQLVTSLYSTLRHKPPCNLTQVASEVQSLIQPFCVLFKNSSVLGKLRRIVNQHFTKVNNAIMNDDSSISEDTLQRLGQFRQETQYLNDS